MAIEVVLPQSAQSGLVLMLQGITFSLLPTPILGPVNCMCRVT